MSHVVAVRKQLSIAGTEPERDAGTEELMLSILEVEDRIKNDTATRDKLEATLVQRLMTNRQPRYDLDGDAELVEAVLRIPESPSVVVKRVRRRGDAG